MTRPGAGSVDACRCDDRLQGHHAALGMLDQNETACDWWDALGREHESGGATPAFHPRQNTRQAPVSRVVVALVTLRPKVLAHPLVHSFTSPPLAAAMEAMRSPQSLICFSARRIAPRRTFVPLYKCLHTSSSRSATPLPHPTTPGPPPEPPTPAPSEAEDRVVRKRKQAELFRKAQEVRTNPAKPKTVLQKRFWKNVTVKDTLGTIKRY
jgi:hypothetical protein